MPLFDLLATVSQKARRFQEFLCSTELIQQIGFPIKAKIPLMLTVTALVMFKNLKLGEIKDTEFEFNAFLSQPSFIPDYINPRSSIDEDECSEKENKNDIECIIGPKLILIPAPQLNDEEAETTFIKECINFGSDLKEKLKIVELHTTIIEKVKQYLDMDEKITNDIDIVLL